MRVARRLLRQRIQFEPSLFRCLNRKVNSAWSRTSGTSLKQPGQGPIRYAGRAATCPQARGGARCVGSARGGVGQEKNSSSSLLLLLTISSSRFFKRWRTTHHTTNNAQQQQRSGSSSSSLFLKASTNGFVLVTWSFSPHRSLVNFLKIHFPSKQYSRSTRHFFWHFLRLKLSQSHCTSQVLINEQERLSNLDLSRTGV